MCYYDFADGRMPGDFSFTGGVGEIVSGDTPRFFTHALKMPFPPDSNTQSSVQFYCTGGGLFGFWLKTTMTFGDVSLYVDNVGQGFISDANTSMGSGPMEWEHFSFELPSGSHLYRLVIGNDVSDPNPPNETAYVTGLGFPGVTRKLGAQKKSSRTRYNRAH